jgi:hypothetical protein
MQIRARCFTDATLWRSLIQALDLVACYQSSSKRKAARLRALENLGEAQQKTRLPACFFVRFGVAFGN